MQKITDYMIVEGFKSAHDMSTAVREFISDGWQPYGDLFAIAREERNALFFFQALVKYEYIDDKVIASLPVAVRALETLATKVEEHLEQGVELDYDDVQLARNAAWMIRRK